MSTEELKPKVRRIVDEAFNKGNLNAMDEIVTAGVILHRPGLPDIKGLEAYKQTIADLRKTYSDFNFTIDEFIMEGDRSAMRWSAGGTHTGQSASLPIPPTGKRVTMTGLSIIRTVNGKAVEEWEYMDVIGLMQQLGVAPPMGSGGK
jgi:predicted ester cyclase